MFPFEMLGPKRAFTESATVALWEKGAYHYYYVLRANWQDLKEQKKTLLLSVVRAELKNLTLI